MSELNATRLAIWDQFETELAQLVFGSSQSFGAAIGQLARKYGSEPAELLLLASGSYCAHFDRLVGIGLDNTLMASQHRFRITTALACDIAALPADARTCATLVAHWHATDDVMFATAQKT